MASCAISGESRKPPSVTTPATPRIMRRATRIDAGRRRARVLAAVDHHHCTGRTFLDRLALRMFAIVKHRYGIQVLARRDVAQRIRLADHVSGRRIEGAHILDELVSQTALEERSGERGNTDGLELGASGVAQWSRDWRHFFSGVEMIYGQGGLAICREMRIITNSAGRTGAMPISQISRPLSMSSCVIVVRST